MDQDIKIYLFIQNILEIINNCELSMGEIKLILESLLLTVNEQYMQNIHTYLTQVQSSINNNNNNNNSEYIPFSIKIPLQYSNNTNSNLDNNKEDSSGQE